LRVGVYSDLRFWLHEGRIRADQSFLVFVGELRASVGSLTITGRLDHGPGEGVYEVPAGVGFHPLPNYAALSNPGEALRAVRGSLRAFWRLLDDVDAVWLMGPHPLAAAFALLARVRGRAVVLGVRQDLPAYIRLRHPGNRPFAVAGFVLEGVWRLLGRACGVVTVGPDLARNYRRSRRVLPVAISLVRAADIAAPRDASGRGGAPFRLLSVGRLDPEKNPLLLADVLAELVRRGHDARLTVCGNGSQQDALAARAAELGVADRADLRGYVPLDELAPLYAEHDALLHVSWTEGEPQVILEAFAAGLPVVGTAVGGVSGQVGDAALLVGPGDAAAAADAVARLIADPALAARLSAAGAERVRERTLEREAGRVAAFIAEEAAAA
jgi:glycosyltransferase involved in cell wall biosynthesis